MKRLRTVWNWILALLTWRTRIVPGARPEQLKMGPLTVLPPVKVPRNLVHGPHRGANRGRRGKHGF